MPETTSCAECGVPNYISTEHLWLDNGDIVHSRDRARRVVFMESENIDPLLKGIEALIGASIEHIVIACVTRNVRAPLSTFVPEVERRRVLKMETDYRGLLDTFMMISEVMGRGKLEVVDLRYRGDDQDFCVFRMTEPFSVPLCCGARAAGIEAILGYDHGVTYQELSPNEYLMTVFPSEHPKGLEGRMSQADYTPRAGGIELERCSTCGVPIAVSPYKWYADRGVILGGTAGRRMVLLAPHELDPVFQELADELGDTIPQTVVEAQRRFTRTGFFEMGELRETNLRLQLAFRGLGNLGAFEIGKPGLSMRLDNAVMPLLMVGMMQGLYEMSYALDSTVDWDLSAEGLLTVEVSPAD
jgi:hypothetical protein